MKFFISFVLFFLASYIVCQTILSQNTQNSSNNVNGVTTTTSTQTTVYSNGSTVIVKTVTTGNTVTKTVSVQPTNSGSTQATLLSSSTSTSNVNGVITSTTTNSYNNGSTVATKTVTSGSTVTITTTVTTGSVSNTWTTVNGSPSGPAPTPSVPAPTPSVPAPTPSVPAPTPSVPAPTPSVPAPSPATGGAQNPVTLPSSDPYSQFNYKVPSSISYADIKSVHLTYINGARSCLGINTVAWNDTLAAHAQAWANTCNIYHASASSVPANPSGNTAYVGEGENIYTFSGSDLTAVKAMQNGNTFFNQEASTFNCQANTCSGTCGHYTQNVWYLTTSIGCGVANCNGGFYGVCRYYPRGNFNWQNPYHPFGGTQYCAVGGGNAANKGFDACKASIAANGRSLDVSAAVQSSSTTTTTTKSEPFFNSNSQIVVFALAIVITVLVVACLIVLVVISKRRTPNKDLEYQLLETK